MARIIWPEADGTCRIEEIPDLVPPTCPEDYVPHSCSSDARGGGKIPSNLIVSGDWVLIDEAFCRDLKFKTGAQRVIVICSEDREEWYEKEAKREAKKKYTAEYKARKLEEDPNYIKNINAHRKEYDLSPERQVQKKKVKDANRSLCGEDPYYTSRKDKQLAKNREVRGIKNATGERREGPCDICKKHRKLCMEHDHESGKIRGWVCGKCNSGMGFFNDDLDLLEEAARYLRKAKERK